MTMLEVREIAVDYDGRAALRNISFALTSGKIVALLGANGAGKTTLIKAINGSIPTTCGQILINGTDLRTMSRRAIAKRIAVVAQENETRFPVSVMEFVLAGRFVHGGSFGWESEADVASARTALRECDFSDLEDRLLNHLSGGERQRVVLARALATEAGLLLLDEPTANLDLAHQAMMIRLVRERCYRANASAMIITHDLNLASEFADEMILLKNGEIIAKGGPEQVLTEENIEAAYQVKTRLDHDPINGKVRVSTIY